eukprot:4834641-Alexandrium_andersonii.AAC.1
MPATPPEGAQQSASSSAASRSRSESPRPRSEAMSSLVTSSQRPAEYTLIKRHFSHHCVATHAWAGEAFLVRKP